MAFLDLHHFSQTLGMGMGLNVLLPEPCQGIGIDGSGWDGEKKLAVLYLLHGRSDDETIWQRRTSIERYVAGRNLAVIMPSTHLAAYTNQAYGRRYFDYISEELPALCRAYFPLSDQREDTFVAGLSMGGYGALKLGLSMPERFSHVIALSAGIDRLALAGEKIKTYSSLDKLREGKDQLSENEYQSLLQFLTNFGSADEYLASERDNLMTLAASSRQKNEQLPKIFMRCGQSDPLLSLNRKFQRRLETLGIEHDYAEAPGTHDWAFWDEHIQAGLDFLPTRSS